MKNLINFIDAANLTTARYVKRLDSISLLALRLYVSWIFFPAGLLKLKDWDTTLFLFEEEYQVPLLSPEFAAWIGTAGELIFPTLLVLGLLTRISALGLFAVNIVAVISLAEIASASLAHHLLWGLSLAIIFVFGGGKINLDYWVSKMNTSSGNISDNQTHTRN